jgi:hypothetical protein
MMMCGSGGCGDDNDEDDANEDWALWDKMTTISVRYHFVPHLVVNHLETDKCLFPQTNFVLLFLVQLYLKE